MGTWRRCPMCKNYAHADMREAIDFNARYEAEHPPRNESDEEFTHASNWRYFLADALGFSSPNCLVAFLASLLLLRRGAA